MTPLVERATGGDVIWLRRFVERVNPSQTRTEPDNFEAGISPAVRREPRAGNAPVLDLCARLDLETAAMTASFEVLVRFVFGGDEKTPSDDDVTQFLRDYGIDYAFGFVRAALADDLRVFGFPPAIMPVDALNEPKATGVRIARPDDEEDAPLA